jgi:hypothetical protein
VLRFSKQGVLLDWKNNMVKKKTGISGCKHFLTNLLQDKRLPDDSLRVY